MLALGFPLYMPWIVIFVVLLVVSASARRRRAMWRMREFEDEVLRSLPNRGGGGAAPPSGPPAAAKSMNLSCTSCGGKATGSDVSPKGEIKCPYCGTWFDGYR